MVVKKFFLLALLLVGATKSMAQQQSEIKYHNNIELNIAGVTLVEFAGALSLGLQGLGGSDGYHTGEISHFPTLNLSYGRQLTPLVNLSGAVSYMQFSADIINADTKLKAGRQIFASLSFVPVVRFDWYRQDIVRLYSKLGIGITDCISRNRYDNDEAKNMTESAVIPAVDVVPFGVAIGGKLYGFGEVSVGTMGFVKAGIGYRF